MRTRLLVALALFACLLIPSAPATKAESQTHAGTYTIIRYYSDATYTTNVGLWMYGSCVATVRRGSMTNYYIATVEPCDTTE